MALPEGFEPYVTTARRYYFTRERDRRRTGLDAAADCFRAFRLGQPGTELPADLPGRGCLVAAGVLAVEEVQGAGPDELVGLGLPRSVAEALITFLEAP